MSDTLTQIELDEAVDKTVQKISVDESKAAILFTDGTFVYIKIKCCPEVDPWFEADIVHPDELCTAFGVDAGIYDRATYEARQKAREEMRAKDNYQRDRQRYEELRQRFEI